MGMDECMTDIKDQNAQYLKVRFAFLALTHQDLHLSRRGLQMKTISLKVNGKIGTQAR